MFQIPTVLTSERSNRGTTDMCTFRAFHDNYIKCYNIKILIFFKTTSIIKYQCGRVQSGRYHHRIRQK